MRTPALALVLATVALAACSGGPTVSQRASAESSGAAQPTGGSRPELIFTGTVPVARDRVVAAECWGSGSPTIVLEAGGTRSDLNSWDYGFLTELAAENTVCRYSRAGGGDSTPPAELLTYDMVINDAFGLLDWARQEHGIQPPYVFVGWSFGGAVAVAEALENPDDTAGIVILDTDPFPTADFMTICMGAGRPAADCEAEFEADLEAQQLGAEIRARLRPLPDIPAAIVSALILPDCRLEPGQTTVAYNMNGRDILAPTCEELASRVADIQAEGWAEVLPQMTQTRVAASHDGLTTHAAARIVQVIRDVVARANSSD